MHKTVDSLNDFRLLGFGVASRPKVHELSWGDDDVRFRRAGKQGAVAGHEGSPRLGAN